MNYDIIIDKLMHHFVRGRYQEELTLAKKEFFQIAGVFDEESDDFEIKMSQFVDWYLFDRKLLNKDETPLVVALSNYDYDIPDELIPFYENLRDQIHSLFEFIKFKKEDIVIRDLFSKKKFLIKKFLFKAGFQKGVFFEARIFPHEDYHVFSRSFCFHPKEVNSFILKQIKLSKKIKRDEVEVRKELIHRLFKMKHKMIQYKHLQTNEIYSNESPLGL
jgi:hypothetical protein